MHVGTWWRYAIILSFLPHVTFATQIKKDPTQATLLKLTTIQNNIGTMQETLQQVTQELADIKTTLETTNLQSQQKISPSQIPELTTQQQPLDPDDILNLANDEEKCLLQ